MAGDYLLDTNIVIALWNAEQQVANQLSMVEAVFLPCIVVGELYYGVMNSLRREENLKRLNELIQTSAILECNHETAFHYGVIKKRLKDLGTPLPENDLWIAALAAQFELQLVTRDKHFFSIHEISVVTW